MTASKEHAVKKFLAVAAVAWVTAAALAIMALSVVSPAHATGFISLTQKDGITPVDGGPYALLTNAAATGSSVQNVTAGSYIWSCAGTFSGATLTLQTLGPDGTTQITVASMTSAGATGVVIGNFATVRVLVAGGTSPAGLYCTLS